MGRNHFVWVGFPPIDPRRLRPTAEIYADAILVGDPGRAMALAQVLVEQPKMSNHARGLWGYSGRTSEGHGLTVQSTGMGGPSAAVVLGDLAGLGVRRAVRIGTCAALSTRPGSGDSDRKERESVPVGPIDAGEARLRPGELVCVREARPWSVDGRGAGMPAYPDEALATRLRSELDQALAKRPGAEAGEAARSGAIASLDVLHPSPGPATPDGDAADMQTAALFATGRDLGLALAAVLIVTEAAGVEPLDDETLADRAAFAAKAATRALFA